jgi:hypothetical protein
MMQKFDTAGAGKLEMKIFKRFMKNLPAATTENEVVVIM